MKSNNRLIHNHCLHLINLIPLVQQEILTILNRFNDKMPNDCFCIIWHSLLLVNPLVQNSNSLLEDLRRLNQLKDSPYQQDLNTEKVSQSKPKQPQSPAKVEGAKKIRF
ncbi:hypothetical protein DRF59_00735 [Chryseobacterium flavum]|uniref:Uncharacterized protein n=1 Tax=Chryseobacterium flavum TaxID=415851 RepID=A0A3D9CUX7_9FLAO|nr:hypothetical protein DRF59_00735 [Chryseobacterium flavum]